MWCPQSIIEMKAAFNNDITVLKLTAVRVMQAHDGTNAAHPDSLK